MEHFFLTVLDFMRVTKEVEDKVYAVKEFLTVEICINLRN